MEWCWQESGICSNLLLVLGWLIILVKNTFHGLLILVVNVELHHLENGKFALTIKPIHVSLGHLSARNFFNFGTYLTLEDKAVIFTLIISFDTSIHHNSNLVPLFETVLIFIPINQTVITAEALIDDPHIVGLQFVEKCIDDASRGLLVLGLEWHNLSSIMAKVNKFEELLTPVYNLQLRVLDGLLQLIELCWVLKLRVSGKSNRNSKLLTVVLNVLFAGDS